jgi:hypothetical protein
MLYAYSLTKYFIALSLQGISRDSAVGIVGVGVRAPVWAKFFFS